MPSPCLLSLLFLISLSHLLSCPPSFPPSCRLLPPPEVRSAAVESMCSLSLQSRVFAKQCLDYLVDMFNDEIEAIRLKAINSLCKISSTLELREDQLETVLAILEVLKIDSFFFFPSSFPPSLSPSHPFFFSPFFIPSFLSPSLPSSLSFSLPLTLSSSLPPSLPPLTLSPSHPLFLPLLPILLPFHSSSCRL